MKYNTVDENCEYYGSNGPESPIKTRCLSPLRYQERDLQKNPDNFSCTSDNHINCPWFPKESKLAKKLF